MNPGIHDYTRVFGSDPSILRIGRAADNDVVLHDSFVSMHHLELRRSEHGWLVKDLGSSSGTTLNGYPIYSTGTAALFGATLQVGRTYLRLDADGVHAFSADPQTAQTMGPPSWTDRQRVLAHPGQASTPPSYMPPAVSPSAATGEGIWAGPGSPHLSSDSSAGQLGQELPHASADNSFVWALAFTPLLYLLVDAALGGTSPESAAVWGLVVALAVNSALVVLDRRRLPELAKPSLWLGLTLIPIYLFQRASRLGQTLAIPVVWCVAFAVSLVLPLATGVGTHIDAAAVEQSIESGIRQQSGLAVTADCPSGITADPRSTFQCVVSAADGSTAIVDVTIQNSTGTFVWQVRN